MGIYNKHFTQRSRNASDEWYQPGEIIPGLRSNGETVPLIEVTPHSKAAKWKEEPERKGIHLHRDLQRIFSEGPQQQTYSLVSMKRAL